jgi:hypothetical protein
MKDISSAVVLLTVLSVSIVAQTSSATEPVLEIRRFTWSESADYGYYDDFDYLLTPAAMDYRFRHRAGRGDFMAYVRVKNVSSKSIKSISLDFFFRDSATDSEFLTYSFRFEKEIGRGKTKDLEHKIAKGKEPDNFRPVAPGYEFLDRTRFCANGPLALDRKTKQLVRIRDNEKLLKTYPCYYLPNVTRIEYTDGSVWQP